MQPTAVRTRCGSVWSCQSVAPGVGLGARLSAATSAFPWLNRILSTSRRQPLIDKVGSVSRACAETLLRVAHLPAALCRVVRHGASTLARAKCFVVRLLLALQHCGFEALVRNLAEFRSEAQGIIAAGGECATVLAVRHSWDETKQLLREPPGSSLARISGQKIARNILVQRTMVHASGALLHPDGRFTECTRSESVIVPPSELYGKSTQFVLAGIRAGLIFPILDLANVRRLAEQVSAIVLSFVGDAASTNRRMLKHLAGVSESPEWPDNAILDLGQICLLHQIHRIKVKIVDVHCQVSLMYCLSKLVRAGSVLHVLANHITDYCSGCQRIVGAPPPESAARARRLLDMVYRLDASHHVLHGTKGERKSLLVRDVEAILRMDNSGIGTGSSDTPLIHYCCGDGGRPCCSSRQETVEKMTSAYLNLFLCHGMPVATLSRWTHVQTVCGILCTAFACRDVFVRALLQGLPDDTNAEEAAERDLPPVAAGAGDADQAAEHRARIAKVRRWLVREDTRVQVACLYLMLRTLDSLTYYLMGGERPEHESHTRPGSLPSAEAALPVGELVGRVGQALAEFARILSTFDDDDSDARFFLVGMGVSNEVINDEQNLRVLRRKMVGASIGIYRRLVLRLRSFPLCLWVLVEHGVPQQTREDVAASFQAQPGCCLGFFGRKLKALCPTKESLLSALGRTIIRTWLRSQHWSIYDAEKEHAACRRLCSGQGPARNFTFVARERVMEGARTRHVERCEVDPAVAAGIRLAGAKRRLQTEGVQPRGSDDSVDKPLHRSSPGAPASLPPWSSGSTPGTATGSRLEGQDGQGQGPGNIAGQVVAPAAAGIAREAAGAAPVEAAAAIVPAGAPQANLRLGLRHLQP